MLKGEIVQVLPVIKAIIELAKCGIELKENVMELLTLAIE